MYGLLNRDLKFILEAISKYPEIEEVIIFGSRAMGNYKRIYRQPYFSVGDLFMQLYSLDAVWRKVETVKPKITRIYYDILRDFLNQECTPQFPQSASKVLILYK